MTELSDYQRMVEKPHLERLRQIIRNQADVITRMGLALAEVTTNGRWTEGEQRGEWAITNEVYETARDALAPAPTGREPR